VGPNEKKKTPKFIKRGNQNVDTFARWIVEAGFKKHLNTILLTIYTHTSHAFH
jgi:hypothetical protein